MPLTALVTAKFSTTTIVRPSASKVCSHGLRTSLPRPSMRRRTLSTLTAPELKSAISAVPKRTKMICSHKNFASDLNELWLGNKMYVENMSKENPGLLEELAIEGQKPPFMVVDCSDSRVSEQDIFSAQPGTMFTAGNIANQFDENDLNSNAVLSFAVESLKVKHVVVMGHYGCGGVAEAMMPLPLTPSKRPADVAVQSWIRPIRELYTTSMRPEIVAHRKKCKLEPLTCLPQLHDSAFRALVEENVKANVGKVARSAVIRDHYASIPSPPPPPQDIVQSLPPSAPVTEVFIHGWVYDVENGQVSDLGVSVGPPGKEVPASPFPLVKVR